MVADGVTLSSLTPDEVRVRIDADAQAKECGFNSVFPKEIEERRRYRTIRAIVNGRVATLAESAIFSPSIALPLTTSKFMLFPPV